ncbi:MAG: hypothetical protein HW421_3850 [Ignavibacteria bacterium]|nr:hypothetical protein [Ignavibacteria bacterium]
MKRTIYILQIIVLSLLISCQKDTAINPKNLIDTNSNSFTIGTQTWMKKNLDIDHYRNGDPIPQVTDSSEWFSLTTGAWCYFNNDSSNGKLYGKLYNFYAVSDPRGLAPAGWHVPSDSEWTVLTNYLGGEEVAGRKMKYSAGIYPGHVPDSNATGESGFNVMLGGFRYVTGEFYDFGYSTHFWSTTPAGIGTNWERDFFYGLPFVYRYFSCAQMFGYSVRLIKD